MHDKTKKKKVVSFFVQKEHKKKKQTQREWHREKKFFRVKNKNVQERCLRYKT